MKSLIALGVLLMIVGGALMFWGYIPYEEKHETEVLGLKLSVTENSRTPYDGTMKR